MLRHLATTPDRSNRHCVHLHRHPPLPHRTWLPPLPPSAGPSAMSSEPQEEQRNHPVTTSQTRNHTSHESSLNCLPIATEYNRTLSLFYHSADMLSKDPKIKLISFRYMTHQTQNLFVCRESNLLITWLSQHELGCLVDALIPSVARVVTIPVLEIPAILPKIQHLV